MIMIRFFFIKSLLLTFAAERDYTVIRDYTVRLGACKVEKEGRFLCKCTKYTHSSSGYILFKNTITVLTVFQVYIKMNTCGCPAKAYMVF
jgi:hypothetical protein